MAKNNEVGLFQHDKGWGYRITLTIDGQRKDTTCKIDSETGKAFKTKRAAKEAREKALFNLKNPPKAKTVDDVTFRDIWGYYMENGAKAKRDSTIKKQESMWRTRIEKEFGDRKLNNVTEADYNNFLIRLYCKENYAYQYVEGFLKFFYLFLGVAFSKKWISVEDYQRLTNNKETRIKMPKKTQLDNDRDNDPEAGVYSQSEIHQLEKIFRRGNCYIAFLLGYYLGVRISECFGLLWENVDWQNGTITINRQLNYTDGMFYLDGVKTLNSSRTIEMPQQLQRALASFQREQRKRQAAAEEKGSWRNTEVVKDCLAVGGSKLVTGMDFINRKENGELLTINSMKYWSKVIKKETGIHFLYHSLRKTHLTMLAAMNTPISELKNRAGHIKSDTTLKYYIKTNSQTKLQLNMNLQALNCEEEYLRIELADETILKMTSGGWRDFEKGLSTITSPVSHKPVSITRISEDEYLEEVKKVSGE